MYSAPIQPDELYHYGIKRRSGRYPWGSGDRPYQRNSFDKSKQEALSNVQRDPKLRSLKTYPNTVKEKFYEDLKHDRIIEKGSFAFRLSRNENETEEGQTYVSFDGDSFDTYVNTLDFDYVTKYVVKKDLKIPSTSKMTQTLIECMMSDPESLNKSVKEYNERVKIPEDVKKQIISDPNKTLIDMYKSFLKDTSSTTGDLGDKVHEKLKGEGYDGVPDLNDMGKHMTTPLFVFDRGSSLEKMSQWEYWDDNADADYTFKYNVRYKD